MVHFIVDYFLLQLNNKITPFLKRTLEEFSSVARARKRRPRDILNWIASRSEEMGQRSVVEWKYF